MTVLGGSTFEAQILSTVGGGGTAGSNINVKRWDGLSAILPSYVTTDPPPGCPGWAFISGAAAGGVNAMRTLTAGIRTGTYGCWVKLGAGTPSGAQRFGGFSASGTNGFRISTTGQIQVICNGAGATSLIDYVPGRKYWCTLKADTSTGTWTITASVYDETGHLLREVTTTQVIAAADLAQVYVGTNGAPGGVDMSIGCPFWSDDLTSYPFPRMGGQLLTPNADGTHSFTTGDFQDNTSANIATSATTVNTLISEVPPNLTAFAKQVVIRSTGLLEVAFADVSRSFLGVPSFVNLIAAMHPVAAQTANTFGFRLNDGGTVTAEAILDTSVATDTLEYRMHGYAVRPNGGTAWTLAAVNALKAQFGFSTDATPPPAMDALYLEVFAPVVFDGNILSAVA